MSGLNQSEVIRMATEAGWDAHHAEFDTRIQTFAALVASAEREAIAQMIEDAPALVEFAQNDQGGCLMCGFTPKLAAKFIRTKDAT